MNDPLSPYPPDGDSRPESPTERGTWGQYRDIVRAPGLSKAVESRPGFVIFACRQGPELTSDARTAVTGCMRAQRSR
jgi:hypothetical protein